MYYTIEWFLCKIKQNILYLISAILLVLLTLFLVFVSDVYTRSRKATFRQADFLVKKYEFFIKNNKMNPTSVYDLSDPDDGYQFTLNGFHGAFSQNGNCFKMELYLYSNSKELLEPPLREHIVCLE